MAEIPQDGFIQPDLNVLIISASLLPSRPASWRVRDKTPYCLLPHNNSEDYMLNNITFAYQNSNTGSHGRKDKIFG